MYLGAVVACWDLSIQLLLIFLSMNQVDMSYLATKATHTVWRRAVNCTWAHEGKVYHFLPLFLRPKVMQVKKNSRWSSGNTCEYRVLLEASWIENSLCT
jgi:hypothetical protein